MSHYWRVARWAEIRRERVLEADLAVRRIAAARLVQADCAKGRHRTETDADTGDEVCRFCGTVTSDW